ncbi:MAG: preprotein translocase subunit YajC [Sulfitobacter litoralis]|jgi:preprotein translocase subunit YajC
MWLRGQGQTGLGCLRKQVIAQCDTGQRYFPLNPPCNALRLTIGSAKLRRQAVCGMRPTQRTTSMEAIQQFVPLILIFAIMYFLLIRPQQKKVKEHKAMVDGLRRGDQVVTAGGLIGKVVKVKEDGELEVELADNVKVRVVQSTVATVVSKTEPAK